jgi:hypothetical protein
MRKLALHALATAVALSLAGAPAPARGVSYEDSLQDCNYPVLFDLAVMRPLSLTALVLGTALWVPLAPWTLLTSASDIDLVTDRLIMAPARFTFGRDLGECTVTKRY